MFERIERLRRSVIEVGKEKEKCENVLVCKSSVEKRERLEKKNDIYNIYIYIYI